MFTPRATASGYESAFAAFIALIISLRISGNLREIKSAKHASGVFSYLGCMCDGL